MQKVKIQIEVAMMVALSIVLSYLKVFAMPNGGSVSLQMLPLIVLAMRHGAVVGVSGGLLFGVISILLSRSIVHPIQAILDYPLAFGVIGLSGLWIRYGRSWNDYVRNIAALVFVCLLRYAAHVISGAIFFSAYAPEGTNAWIYSAIYNVTYLAPEMLVTIAVALLMLTRKSMFK